MPRGGLKSIKYTKENGAEECFAAKTPFIKKRGGNMP